MGFKQKLIRDLIYYFLITLYKLANKLPVKLDLLFGKFVGTLCYYILKRERERALTHLNFVYGEQKSKKEIERIAKENFKRIGVNVMECICMERLVNKLHELVTVKGLEIVQNALNKGTGVIWITGHLGNWEIMPVYFAKVLKLPVSVVAAPLYDERLTSFINQWRAKFDVQTIIRGGLSSYRMIREAFLKNKILGLLIDQDTRVPGVFVDFFGKKAFTPRGAIDLALKFDASIVVGFCRRTSKLSHEIKIYNYSVVKDDDYETTVIKNTQALTKIIEKEISSRPEDWVWMHRRWKKKPESEFT